MFMPKIIKVFNFFGEIGYSGGLAPGGPGGQDNSDTNMAIYTHVSSNYTHICPIIGHFRGS